MSKGVKGEQELKESSKKERACGSGRMRDLE